MKFQIKVDDLIKILLPVGEVCYKKKFSRFYITAGKENIVIQSDLVHQSISCTISSQEFKNYRFPHKDILEISVSVRDFMTSLYSFDKDEVIKIRISNKFVCMFGETKPKSMLSLNVKQERLCNTVKKLPQRDCICIDRKIMLTGIQSVKHAMGNDRKKPSRKSIAIKAYGNKKQFIAGTGDFFAIYEAESKNVKRNKKAHTIVLPRESVPYLVKLLSFTTAEIVKINNTCPHGEILIQAGDIVLCIKSGMKQKYNYSDKYIKAKHSYRLASNYSDWQSPLQGIKAIYDSRNSKKDTVNTDITIDIDNGYIILESTTGMKSKRCIPLVPNTYIEPDIGSIVLRCNSKHLLGILKFYNDGETIFSYDGDCNPTIFEFSTVFNPQLKIKERKYLIFKTSRMQEAE